MRSQEFEVIFFDEAKSFPTNWPRASFSKPPKHHRAPPMKINMLLHFYAEYGPFAPEAQRRSPAYTQFVKELLREGLIVRPTTTQREEYPGWAYRTTEKGGAWVNAICTVPVPVARPRWIIPS